MSGSKCRSASKCGKPHWASIIFPTNDFPAPQVPNKKRIIVPPFNHKKDAVTWNAPLVFLTNQKLELGLDRGFGSVSLSGEIIAAGAIVTGVSFGLGLVYDCRKTHQPAVCATCTNTVRN